MWALLSNFKALWRKPYSIYTCKFWNFPTCFWWPQGKFSSLCPIWGKRGGGGVMRGIPPPTSWKIGHSLHLEKYPPHIIIFMLQPNKNFIFRCSHCSCTTFILTSYSVLTGHSYFEIRQCSIFRECYFLALKKVQMIKFTTLQISTTQ